MKRCLLLSAVLAVSLIAFGGICTPDHDDDDNHATDDDEDDDDSSDDDLLDDDLVDDDLDDDADDDLDDDADDDLDDDATDDDSSDDDADDDVDDDVDDDLDDDTVDDDSTDDDADDDLDDDSADDDSVAVFTELIDESGENDVPLGHVSLAIGLDDALYVAYQFTFRDDCGHAEQAYATNETGVWQYTRVEVGECDFPDPPFYHSRYLNISSGSPNSLALDSAARPHLAYHATYSMKDGGSTWPPIWTYDYRGHVRLTDLTGTPETVDGDETSEYDTDMTRTGEGVALAMSADDAAHLLYNKWFEEEDESRLIYRASPAGPAEVVDVCNVEIVGTSMILADDGAVHAVYVCFTDLGYGDSSAELRQATDESGAWVVTVLDAWNYTTAFGAGDIPYDISLAADADGDLHLAYSRIVSDDKGELLFAERAGGEWSTDVVDGTNIVGWDVSLVVDETGENHIAYYDRGGGRLMYARGEPGSWTIAALDSRERAGGDNDIVRDSAGAYHVVYTFGSLLYSPYEGLWHAIIPAEWPPGEDQ